MLTASIGFETPGMKNNGRDFYFPVIQAMTLNGIQVDCSYAAYPEPKAGFSEMFVCGYLLDGPPVFGVGPEGFFQTLPAPGFGARSHYPSDGNVDFRGGNVSKGGLFSFIMKEFMPRGTDKTCYIPLELAAIPGNHLMFHADHWGAGPVDFEFQAILNYTFA